MPRKIMPVRNKDVELSVQLDELIQAKPNDCYANACRVIQTIPDYQNSTYVEGFGVAMGVEPFEHGWILHNGSIIDPTLAREHVWYLPAIEFVGAAGIQKFMLSEGMTEPPFYKSPQFKTKFAVIEKRAIEFRTKGIHKAQSFDEMLKHSVENSLIVMSKSFRKR